MSENLDKVQQELAGYKHPFFEFSASESGGVIDVCVKSTLRSVHSPEYHFSLTPREVDHPQFRWSFQGLLYGNLNDYMVELFTGAPGDPD